MSNIYIQEPPTSGKVLLKTSIGDFDIELWAKEAPKASRNFIQLCLEGYYDNLIFHRIVKGFIAQGGDPLGTGEGGESIYGQPFKDEFHSRLRFCRRGLVAMANAGKNDNGSQFFFTLAATPELQNKHTIFGTVTGDTKYNLLKFEECPVDEDERPIHPPKILKTQVLSNPFGDIVPRVNLKNKKKEEEEKEKKQQNKKGVKDIKLLSFGDEVEEYEEEIKELNKQFSGKSKSAHDILDDPKLSSEPALEENTTPSQKRKEVGGSNSEEEEYDKTEEELEVSRKGQRELNKIKEKLKGAKKLKEDSSKQIKVEEKEEEEYYLGKDHADQRKKLAEAFKKEIRDFKRSNKAEKIKAEETKELEMQKKKEKMIKKEAMKELREQKEKAKEGTEKSKSLIGDDFVARKLMSLKKKITAMKEIDGDNSEEQHKNDEEEDEDDEKLLSHAVHCQDKTPVLAKDANLKDDDWFEIYDPRNPINKRRRGETTKKGEGDRKNRPPRT